MDPVQVSKKTMRVEPFHRRSDGEWRIAVPACSS
jgi:hypothetical protein